MSGSSAAAVTPTPRDEQREPVTESSGEPAGTLAEDPKIAALEARVRKLEGLLGQILAAQALPDESEAQVQPHVAWIEKNRDVLRAYPDSFVALDPDEGIVVHSTDGDEFAAKLAELPAEQQDRVVLFHSSMYV